MTRWIVVVVACASLAACGAPPVAPPAVPPADPVDSLDSASDEFNDPATLSTWQVMQGETPDGTPSTFDIGRTTAGVLTVVPSRSWWVNNTRGFYAYKQIQGDFVVTVRLRAAGRTTALPTVDWSLVGLLLRNPTGPAEHWVGYTAGFVGAPRVERKTTRSSRSELRLIPVEPGWIELRAVRTGPLVSLLRRQGGDQQWALDGVYDRPELAPILQVGIDAQSGYDADRPDLLAEVDWIRFTATGIPAGESDAVLSRLTRAVSRDNGNTLNDADTGVVQTALLHYVT